MLKKKLKILATGAYDSYNLGDDLVFLAIIHFLKENMNLSDNDLELYVQKHQHSLEKLNWNLDFTLKDGFKIDWITKRWGSSDAPEIVKVFSKYVSFFILIVDIIIYKLTGGCLFFQKVCGFFKNLDVIYYIGGGYFSEDWPKRLYIEFIVVNMAKIYNPELKIIGTGMGIGPFRKRLPLYMLREFFSKFDYIFTREEESLLSLRQLGIKAEVKCCGDDVLLFLPVLIKLKQESNKRKAGKQFAFNIKNYRDHDYTEIKEEFNQYFEFLKKQGYQLNYFCFEASIACDDCDLFKKIFEGNGYIKFKLHNPYKDGIEDFLRNLLESDLGTGFAYHFNYLLSMLSIPLIAIYAGRYYQQKVSGAMKMLLSPFVHDIERVNCEMLQKAFNARGFNNKDRVLYLYEEMTKEYSGVFRELINKRRAG